MQPDARQNAVAQASPPASSSTVSVRESGIRDLPIEHSGGETPPKLAAGTAALPDPLVSGMHFRGVLPHVKKEGSTYFVTFRQAGTLPKEVLLRFKQERDTMMKTCTAAVIIR